jgi:hypothetical protein
MRKKSLVRLVRSPLLPPAKFKKTIFHPIYESESGNCCYCDSRFCIYCRTSRTHRTASLGADSRGTAPVILPYRAVPPYFAVMFTVPAPYRPPSKSGSQSAWNSGSILLFLPYRCGLALVKAVRHGTAGTAKKVEVGKI